MQFETKKHVPADVNNGQKFNGGDGVRSDDLNAVVEMSMFAQDVVDTITAVGEKVAPDAPAAASVETLEGGRKRIRLKIPQGVKGDTGSTPVITATAKKLETGATPTVAVTGEPETPNIEFGIPKGDTGRTPAIAIGTVSSVAPDEAPLVTLRGTAEQPIMDMKLPMGKQGGPGSGVAAGLSSVPVLLDDWQEDATRGYKLVITPAQHCIGETNQIMVESNPYLNASGTVVRTSFDSAEKAPDGTITLYSRIRWEGLIFCSGGAANALDAQARQNIEMHKADAVAHITAAERSAWNAKETPTAAQSKADNALQAAKTYADNKVADLVGSAPELLDTLKELASAVGDNPNHAAEMMELVGKKADKSAFEAHAGNNEMHITATERNTWNSKETPAAAQAKADAALQAANTHTDTVAAGKADKIVYEAHAANNDIHIKTAERTAWNAKETPSAAQAKADAALQAANANTAAHVGDKANPHAVTPAQIGLGNVDNTHDADKSVAAADALNIVYGNEIVIGKGFAGGEIYMGYRGTDGAISAYRFCDGTASGTLSAIRASALYEGETRVYSPLNPPAAEDIASGTLNALRIPPDFLQAGNNISLSRDASGKVTITANFGTTAPFKKTVSESDWEPAKNGYTHIILAAEHGKGIDPTVEIFNNYRRQMYDSPQIAENGDVKLYSNTQTTVYVKIR